MNPPRSSFVLVVAFAILGTAAGSARGWQAASECLDCHIDLGFGTNLHSLHVDYVDDCQDCHQASTSDPILTNNSANHAEHSCNGCHQVAGLATVHGEVSCGTTPCHGAIIGTAEGEDVLPYFYVAGRSSVVNPCRLDPDNGGEDWDLDGFGLDNDGDGLYDADDPDCAGIVDTQEATWSVMKALFGDD